MDQNILEKKKAEFKNLFPGVVFLAQSEPQALEKYLKTQKQISQTDHVLKVDKAGDGNMNLTLRVTTEEKSIIIKQSRPWVEKYPAIAAPVHRTSIEGIFYKSIIQHEFLRQHIPAIYGLDERANIIFLEDLGSIESLESAYKGDPIPEKVIKLLVRWLSALHNKEFSPETKHLLKNLKMRILNHEHIFELPLRRNNGLYLDKITLGLDKIAQELKWNMSYCKKVEELGNLYLTEGKSLLHGDYYPGSWMLKQDKVYILDPEFCFFGMPEFDLGVMLAHLVLSRQNLETQNAVINNYESLTPIRNKLVFNFAGVEIMRRLIGVAQLPVSAEKDWKEDMLMKSLEWVML